MARHSRAASSLFAITALMVAGLNLVAAVPAAAAEEPAVTNGGQPAATPSPGVWFPTGATRALVVIQAEKPRPDGIRVCSLLPQERDPTGDLQPMRHLDPGATLVLVNLSDVVVDFVFGTDDLFVEGRTFRLGPDEVRMVTARHRTVSPDTPVSSLVNVYDMSNPKKSCFVDLPGPVMLLP